MAVEFRARPVDPKTANAWPIFDIAVPRSRKLLHARISRHCSEGGCDVCWYSSISSRVIPRGFQRPHEVVSTYIEAKRLSFEACINQSCVYCDTDGYTQIWSAVPVAFAGDELMRVVDTGLEARRLLHQPDCTAIALCREASCASQGMYASRRLWNWKVVVLAWQSGRVHSSGGTRRSIRSL